MIDRRDGFLVTSGPLAEPQRLDIRQLSGVEHIYALIQNPKPFQPAHGGIAPLSQADKKAAEKAATDVVQKAQRLAPPRR